MASARWSGWWLRTELCERSCALKVSDQRLLNGVYPKMRSPTLKAAWERTVTHNRYYQQPTKDSGRNQIPARVLSVLGAMRPQE